MSNYDDSDMLRTCIFRPYRRGLGPSFRLVTWSTGRYDVRGQSIIGYRLTMHTPHDPRPHVVRSMATVLFEGEDFAGSPMHADDSDECMRSLMTFLTLRPGDTDAEFFTSDTQEQREYRVLHAEALNMEVCNRFGWGD